MKKKTTNTRAAGKTQISISLPVELVERIDALAANERRNRSNFIATTLERLANDVDAANRAAFATPEPTIRRR